MAVTLPPRFENLRVLHMMAGAGVGGAEMFFLDAIKALHDAGVQQHIITRDYDHYLKAFDDRGISYDVVKYNGVDKLFGTTSRLVKKRIETFDPNLLHSWLGRASSYVPGDLQLPVLGWFGGYYDLKRFKNCQFFAGVTRDLKRYLVEQSGQEDHCYCLHTFGTLEEAAPVSRADFDLPYDNKSIILLLSRMHWKKGVDTLLEAMNQIDDAYVLLAGSGPDLEKYQAMATELGVEDKVRFLGWRDDRKALLELADVCVLPSRYEPFGTVIAESWFAEVPLVAAKAQGAVQYVEHDKNGLLCEIDDVDGLALQLQRAVSDDALRTNLVSEGTKIYNELFSREVVTQTMIDAYGDMLSKYTPD